MPIQVKAQTLYFQIMHYKEQNYSLEKTTLKSKKITCKPGSSGRSDENLFQHMELGRLTLDDREQFGKP